MAVDPFVYTLVAVMASALFYYLSSLGANNRMKMLVVENHINSEAILKIIQNNGTETRKSIVESVNKTLEVIERSHLVTKIELKELLEIHEG